MKKIIIICVSVILALAVIAMIALIGFVKSPEYAIIKISNAYEQDGIKGWKSFMTRNAEEKLEPMMELSDEDLFRYIANLLDTRYPDAAADGESDSFEWEMGVLLKSGQKAALCIDFQYGTMSDYMDIVLIKIDGEWKIDDVRLP